jgi:integrase/recombinase XerD
MPRRAQGFVGIRVISPQPRGIRLASPTLHRWLFARGLGSFKPKEPAMPTRQISVNPNTYEIAAELFGDQLDAFRQHLLDLTHARSTVGHHLRCIAYLGEAMKAHSIPLVELDDAQALAIIEKTGWRRKRKTYAAFIMKRFICFLNGRGLARPPSPRTAKEIARAELKGDYESYLRRQRGLSERTIFHCWRFADRFLEFRFGDAVGDLSQITSSDIAAFLLHLTTRTPPFRDKTPPTHLRNFFRYLFKAGKTNANLSLAIPSVAQRYRARLPRHLAPEQVDVVLDAVRTTTPSGRRNYAMLMLLARLGLRPPEVIAMQIDDIDWRSGEIIIRGKGDRHDRLPLLPDVGEALADYIRLDRVTTSRALFVTERPPHRPFKSSELLNHILKGAFASSGLTPPPPYVGAHILRHSLATNLVRRGASLEEIGDTLRHRSRASTMIYARLDIEGLRSIALPWPVAGDAA